MRRFLTLFAPLLLLFAACGEGEESSGDANAGPQTPEEAYARLVSAVERGDYGYMYDILDSTYKQFVPKMIELQLSQVDKMDSLERMRWEQLRGVTDPREAFRRLMLMTPEVTSNYRGGYKVLNVDTVISVTVQHANLPPTVVYFKWQDGMLRYTPPPDAPGRPAAQVVATPRGGPPAPSNGAVPDSGR